MLPDAYVPLVQQVDALTADIGRRRAVDLSCRRGCSACCHVQLTVTPLEARRVGEELARLEAGVRERIRERGRALAALERVPEGSACVMLQDDGACAIYAARPLVCRTQGHALRYPEGSLQELAVFATAPGSEITWCPLNYIERPPKSEDVIEAQRVDERLGLACLAEGQDPLKRVPLVQLALD